MEQVDSVLIESQDSVAVVPQDSVQNSVYEGFELFPDSLFVESVAANPYNPQLFGEASTLVVNDHSQMPQSFVYQSVGFNVLLLISALIVALVLHRWVSLRDHFEMLLDASRRDDDIKGELSVGSRSTPIYIWFGVIVAALGSLLFVLFATRFTALYGDVPLLRDISYGEYNRWSYFMAAAPAILLIFQSLLLWVIALFTLNYSAVARIIQLKLTIFSIATLVLAPVVLIYAVSLPEQEFVIQSVLCAIGCLVLIVYIFKTFTLFIKEKISILHWFLYLCTVEVVPMSTIWVLMTRS